MADHLRKYESLFTLTPQRMRIIVDAFKDTLEAGLAKEGEIVVRLYSPSHIVHYVNSCSFLAAYDSHMGIWLANWERGRRLLSRRSGCVLPTASFMTQYLICSLSPFPYSLPPGGTNLRVCLVTLQGSGRFEITQSKYRLTEEQKQDDGQVRYIYVLVRTSACVSSSLFAIPERPFPSSEITQLLTLLPHRTSSTSLPNVFASSSSPTKPSRT